VVSAPGLKTVVAALPPDCYDSPTWKGLAYFARDLAIYAGTVAALVPTDNVLLLPFLWVLGGLAIGGLFVLGHDAAHGALFRSKRLCRVIGRIALLPSLHAYEVWVLGHNRVHHGHTGCRGIDFVWHPLTPAQYRALPPAARLLHRLEWSPWGAGLYYLRVLWWQRMMRIVPPPRLRRVFRRDRMLVWSFLGVMSGMLLLAGGTPGTGLWLWIKVFLVPWLVWNWLIGVTVHVHHIAPEIAWHPRERWNRLPGQVDGTSSYRIPRALNLFWHNIFLHVPHHVDPRIPFYRLPRAAEALTHILDAAEPVRALRLRDYARATRRCKLYDFERSVWLDYAGNAATPAA
jgi:omega-6 fatty acid desaturase (delta-12 desaturase)